ncbi:MAG: efflux RND transporter periplasmic adaptor subunit [Anaerolineaceae bacterium]|nr:efflux RND transporter periplasmic adaptor subunit [Anaerolineaceae bacterium]
MKLNIKGFFNKIWAAIWKRKWLSLGIAILLIAVAAGVINNLAKRAEAIESYQTASISRGTLTATVGATGTVRARQSATLYWQTSGTVADVQTKLDEKVTKQEKLVSLEKMSLPQSIILADAELVTAERDLENARLSNTPTANAMLVFYQAQRAYEEANNARYRTGFAEHASEQDIIDARAALKIRQQEVDRYQSLYDDIEDIPGNKTRLQNAYDQLQEAIANRNAAQARLDYYLSEYQRTHEADAQVAVAKARLEDARREWERLKDGPDARDILAAQARVDATLATVNMQYIFAPFNGVVTMVNNKPGDQVRAGDPAIRLDDTAQLLVDVEISEVDINAIEVGQPVKLSFDAIMDKAYDGIVLEVSRVGEMSAGVVNFTVKIGLTNADSDVKPGMTAAVTITTRQLENVLLVPNRAVRLVDGKRVVYILLDGQLTTINIELGATADLYSEVLGGDLKEGDLIVLNPPAFFLSSGSMFMMGN